MRMLNIFGLGRFISTTRNTADAGVNPGSRTLIFKRLEPFMIDVSLPYFDRADI